MNYSLRVSLPQSATDLASDVYGASDAEHADSIEQRADRFTLNVLHRNARTFPDVREFVDAADVLVGDFPSDAQFILKALHHQLVVQDFAFEDFQGDTLRCLAIHGLVNNTHATAANFLKNVVSVVLSHLMSPQPGV